MALAWVGYLSALLLLSAYGAHRLWLTVRYWRLRERGPAVAALPQAPADAPADAAIAELPVVTVQLPIYNERCVAERLIDAVAALDWPRDRLHIQVLDDSSDDTAALCRDKVAALRRAGYDIEHRHRQDRQGFKAGALEAGLAASKGAFVLILDADFVVPSDFLRAAMGCFADPRVGMVQTRWAHLNRDASVLTRIQALLLDGHFVVDQTARARSGHFFNFNGTAGIWRREAIVAAGGWQHDTLTEDLDLSYRALLAGWRFEYLLERETPAELPEDMNAFKSQQFRWAKGSLEVAKKILPAVLGSAQPWRVKLDACFHLTQNLPYLVTLVLLLCAAPVLVLAGDMPSWLAAVHAGLLAATALTFAIYCMTAQRALRRSPWRTLCLLPVTLSVVAGISLSQTQAVLEGLLGSRSAFVRTPKGGHGARAARRTRRYRGALRGIVIAELALFAYFSLFLLLAWWSGGWQRIVPMAMFTAGFAYVGTRSLLDA